MEIRVHLSPLMAAARPEHRERFLEVEINGKLSPWSQEALAEWGRKQVGMRRCMKLFTRESNWKMC